MMELYRIKLEGTNNFNCLTKIGDQELYVRGQHDTYIKHGGTCCDVIDIEIDLLDNNAWTLLNEDVVDFEELCVKLEALMIELERD